MKTFNKGAIRDEKGQVLILALVLLFVGGLILTPLLGLMSTGLLAGQVYEKKMDELYAADAGIEDALWKIQHNIDIPTDGYNLTVNDKYVRVTITTIDVETFLTEMLEYNMTNEPHSDWMLTYKSPAAGIFGINITWNGTAQNKRITSVGAWLSGNYSYVEGQDIPVGDIREAYPSYTFDPEGFSFSGGMAFIWEWPSNPDRPTFNPGDIMTLTFHFTPEDTPADGIGWALVGSSDVGLVYDAELGIRTITATATTDTGTSTADIDSQTTVVAHVERRGCAGDEIEVLNWNIS